MNASISTSATVVESTRGLSAKNFSSDSIHDDVVTLLSWLAVNQCDPAEIAETDFLALSMQFLLHTLRDDEESHKTLEEMGFCNSVDSVVLSAISFLETVEGDRVHRREFEALRQQWLISRSHKFLTDQKSPPPPVAESPSHKVSVLFVEPVAPPVLETESNARQLAEAVLEQAVLLAGKTLSQAREDAEKLLADAQKQLQILEEERDKIIQSANAEVEQSIVGEGTILHHTLLQKLDEEQDQPTPPLHQETESQAQALLDEALRKARQMADTILQQSVQSAADIMNNAMLEAEHLAMEERKRIIGEAIKEGQKLHYLAARKARKILDNARQSTQSDKENNVLILSDTKQLGIPIVTTLSTLIAKYPVEKLPLIIHRLGVAVEDILKYGNNITQDEIMARLNTMEAPKIHESVLTDTSTQGIPPSISGSILAMFDAITLLTSLLSRSTKQLSNASLDLLGFYRSLFKLYPFINSSDDADHILYRNLTLYIYRLTRYLESIPFATEHVMGFISVTEPLLREAMAEIRLPEEKESQRSKLLQRVLLMRSDPLRCINTLPIICNRMEYEYVRGIISKDSLPIFEEVLTELVPPQAWKQFQTAAIPLFNMYRLTPTTALDWDGLLTSSVTQNIVDIIKRRIMDLRKDGTFHEQFISTCSRRLLHNHNSWNDTETSKESHFQLELLRMQQVEWEALIQAIYDIATLCLTPEVGQLLLEIPGDKQRLVIGFTCNQPAFLKAMGMADGAPKRRVTLSKRQIDDINAILSSLSPRVQEVCLLQLLHRGLVDLATLEKVLRLNPLTKEKGSLRKHMPELVVELLARLRWDVVQLWMVNKGLQPLLPGIVKSNDISTTKTLLVNLGLNQPDPNLQVNEEDDEPMGAVDATLAIKDMLDGLLDAMEQLNNHKEERTSFLSWTKSNQKKAMEENVQRWLTRFKRTGFEQKAHMLVDAVRKNASQNIP